MDTRKRQGAEPSVHDHERRLNRIESILDGNQLSGPEPPVEVSTDPAVWLGTDDGSEDFYWVAIDPTLPPVHVAVPRPPFEYFDGRDPATLEQQEAYRVWLTTYLPGLATRDLSSGVDANGQHQADWAQAKQKAYHDVTKGFPPFPPRSSGMGSAPPE